MKNMKNRLKKFVSIFLILVLALLPFSFILDTKAEKVDILVDDTKCNEKGCFVTNEAAITIDGSFQGAMRTDLVAYKVLDIYYDESANEMNYDFTDSFKNFLKQSDEYKDLTIEDYFNLTSDDPKNMAVGSVITKSNLNKLISKFAVYIRKNNIEGKDDFNSLGDLKYMVSVVAGTYLVFPSSASGIADNVPPFIASSFNGVMIGNVTFTNNEDGSWTLNSPQIVSKSSLGIISSGILPVTLEEFKEDYKDGDLDAEIIDSFILANNNEITFVFGGLLPKVPSNAPAPQWEANFEFSEGLNYTDLNCMIFKGDTVTDVPASDIADVLIEGKKVKIKLNQTFLESNNSLVGVIFFCGVSLNDNALMGGIQFSEDTVIPVNTNYIKTTYTTPNDPYVENDINTLDLTSYIAGFGIELENVNEKGEVLPAGGEYEVYLDEELTELVDTIKVSPDGRLLSKAIVDGRGNLGFYIKQTEPLAGYGLSDSIYYVDFGNVPEEALQDIYLNGYYKTQIVHKKSKILPITGGIGTIIYTVIGLLIIIIGVVFFLYYRKRSLKKDDNNGKVVNKEDSDIELI